MKISRKTLKNICIKASFSLFFRYICNQNAKTVDLPAFSGVFTGLVSVEVSSHVNAGAHSRRCVL